MKNERRAVGERRNPPGRNSPVAVLVAVLVMVTIGGVVLQRHQEIEKHQRSDQQVDQFVADLCVVFPEDC